MIYFWLKKSKCNIRFWKKVWRILWEKFLSIDNLYFSFACVKWVKNFPINWFKKQFSQYVKLVSNIGMTFPKRFWKISLFQIWKMSWIWKNDKCWPHVQNLGGVVGLFRIWQMNYGKNPTKIKKNKNATRIFIIIIATWTLRIFWPLWKKLCMVVEHWMIHLHF